MRNILVLQLLAMPTAIGSALLLLIATPAQAREIIWDAQSNAAAEGEFCSAPTASNAASSNANSTSANDAGSDGNNELMSFTVAESDAAVLLFGCDCPPCLSALAQLRNPSLVAAVQGHCWNNLSDQQYEQQEIDQILDAIEDANRQGPETPLTAS